MARLQAAHREPQPRAVELEQRRRLPLRSVGTDRDPVSGPRRHRRPDRERPELDPATLDADFARDGMDPLRIPAADPLARRAFRNCFSSLAATAKARPWARVPSFSRTIPMTSPVLALTIGPPEFPGLIEASVWSSTTPSILRYALTIPRMNVASRPSGVPTA